MKLSRQSRLVRFAYFFSDFGPPNCTTLCAFFWRAFVLTPLVWFGVIFVLGVLIFHFAKFYYISVPVTVTAVAMFFAVARWVDGSKRKRREREYARERGEQVPPTVRERIADSVFWQGLKTVKGKVCPLIELTSDN